MALHDCKTWKWKVMPICGLFGRISRKFTDTVTNRLFSETTKSARIQRHLIVIDSADPHASIVFANIRVAFELAKLNYLVFDISMPGGHLGLASCSSVVMCAERLDLLDAEKIHMLKAFVSGGGGLAVLYRGSHPDLSDLFGIEEQSTVPGYLGECDDGLVFKENGIPGFAGLKLDPREVGGHVPFKVRLKSGCHLLAETLSGVPIAWSNEFHDGHVIFWNTSVLANKNLRGLAVYSALAVQKIAAQVIANTAMLHVDDFPPPYRFDVGDELKELISASTLREFYFDIWFHDICSLSEDQNLTFTFYSILDYDVDITTDPEEHRNDYLSAAVHRFPSKEMREVEKRFEVGLHGLNHLPLTLVNWKSHDSMRRWLSLCRELWMRLNQDTVPCSYVPPNNEIDPAGLSVLLEIFPEIESFCSVYSSGEYRNGANREFGIDPNYPNLIQLSRETNGYIATDENLIMMASQILTLGIWTHFIHPDDVLDIPNSHGVDTFWRNPHAQPWRGDATNDEPGLLEEFSRWVTKVRTEYPWLKFMTTSGARQKMFDFMVAETSVQILSNKIVILGAEGLLVKLMLDANLSLNPLSARGCSLSHISEGHLTTDHYYEVHEPECSVEYL